MMPEWVLTQAQAEADFAIRRLGDIGVRVVGDLESAESAHARRAGASRAAPDTPGRRTAVGNRQCGAQAGPEAGEGARS